MGYLYLTFLHAAAAGLLLSAVPAGDIDRQQRPPGAQHCSTAHSSKLRSAANREQCHVDS